jgi:hypothetical protein
MNNMSERNEFLEMDGLYWESETHEWFHDKTSTQYARKKSILWGSGEQNDALNVVCFVVRDKESGEYDRLMLDKDKEEVIFDTKSLEAMGYEIDRMKVIKRFNVKN